MLASVINKSNSCRFLYNSRIFGSLYSFFDKLPNEFLNCLTAAIPSFSVTSNILLSSLLVKTDIECVISVAFGWFNPGDKPLKTVI